MCQGAKEWQLQYWRIWLEMADKSLLQEPPNNTSSHSCSLLPLDRPVNFEHEVEFEPQPLLQPRSRQGAGVHYNAKVRGLHAVCKHPVVCWVGMPLVLLLTLGAGMEARCIMRSNKRAVAVYWTAIAARAVTMLWDGCVCRAMAAFQL
jgi:hypothetical protein